MAKKLEIYNITKCPDCPWYNGDGQQECGNPKRPDYTVKWDRVPDDCTLEDMTNG